MSATISIRFATNDIRDLSDGGLPVEVWTVYTKPDGTKSERHEGTPRMQHTIAEHVRRAARGLRLTEKKHVEIRTPAARKETA